MISGYTFADVYKKLAKCMQENGQVVSPRGMKTKELLQASFCIENPWMNLAYIKGRNFSLMHALAESLLLVTKENSVACYTLMNENMSDYSDDGKTLHGAYGYRIADSISACVQKLREDKDTRQAILTIHRLSDLHESSKDIPCTICLQFTIRNDSLNMHVYMRSNDIVWGTPYDVFVFTNLQMVIANTLGIKVGRYYHTVTSLHVYEKHFELLDKIADSEVESHGHYNRNELDDWSMLGQVYCYFAKLKTKEWLAIKMMDAYDQDGNYTFAFGMEAAYRFFKGQKYPDVFFENGASAIKYNYYGTWLKQFTRRWWDK